MKTAFWTIFTFAIIGYIFYVVHAYAQYAKIQSHWVLADRASTIDQKSKHIDNFIHALESTGLQGTYSSLFIVNEGNSFDANLNALKTLQQRLVEIKDMDVKSFEYQTAIQQITAQEQGEANEMLSVLSSCYMRENHILAWGINPDLIIIGFVLLAFLAQFYFKTKNHHHDK